MLIVYLLIAITTCLNIRVNAEEPLLKYRLQRKFLERLFHQRDQQVVHLFGDYRDHTKEMGIKIEAVGNTTFWETTDFDYILENATMGASVGPGIIELRGDGYRIPIEKMEILFEIYELEEPIKRTSLLTQYRNITLKSKALELGEVLGARWKVEKYNATNTAKKFVDVDNVQISTKDAQNFDLIEATNISVDASREFLINNSSNFTVGNSNKFGVKHCVNLTIDNSKDFIITGSENVIITNSQNFTVVDSAGVNVKNVKDFSMTHSTRAKSPAISWAIEDQPLSPSIDTSEIRARAQEAMEKQMDWVINQMYGDEEGFVPVELQLMDSFSLIMFGARYAKHVKFERDFVEIGVNTNMVAEREVRETHFSQYGDGEGLQSAAQFLVNEDFLNTILFDQLTTDDQFFSLRNALPKTWQSSIEDQLKSSIIGKILPNIASQYGSDRDLDIDFSFSHDLFQAEAPEGAPQERSGVKISKDKIWKFNLNFIAYLKVETSPNQWEIARKIYASVEADIMFELTGYFNYLFNQQKAQIKYLKVVKPGQEALSHSEKKAGSGEEESDSDDEASQELKRSKQEGMMLYSFGNIQLEGLQKGMIHQQFINDDLKRIFNETVICNGVDLEVQSTFNDGQYQLSLNYRENRARDILDHCVPCKILNCHDFVRRITEDGVDFHHQHTPFTNWLEVVGIDDPIYFWNVTRNMLGVGDEMEKIQIDMVKIIDFEKNVEQRQKLESLLPKWIDPEIEVSWFKAVDPSSKKMQDLLQINQLRFPHFQMTDKTGYGQLLAHLMLVEHIWALDNQPEFVLVMEEDVEFTRKFPKETWIPKDADLVLFDNSHAGHAYNLDYSKATLGESAGAYLLRVSSIPEYVTGLFRTFHHLAQGQMDLSRLGKLKVYSSNEHYIDSRRSLRSTGEPDQEVAEVVEEQQKPSKQEHSYEKDEL